MKPQSVPDYITYYFREGQKPFEVLTDLDPDIAQEILKNDTLWWGDGTYLKHRRTRSLSDLGPTAGEGMGRLWYDGPWPNDW